MAETRQVTVRDILRAIIDQYPVGGLDVPVNPDRATKFMSITLYGQSFTVDFDAKLVHVQ